MALLVELFGSTLEIVSRCPVADVNAAVLYLADTK